MKRAMRTLSATAVVGIALSPFALGSGGHVQAAHAATVHTVSFGIGYGSALNVTPIRILVDAFNRTHPDIHVILETNDNSTKFQLQLAAGTAPDVKIFGTGHDFGSWAFNGALDDLTPLVKKTRFPLNEIVPSTIEEGTLMYNHQLYALPFLEDTYELYYNKDDLRQARITVLPKTLNQLVADAKKMTKYNKQGQITQLGWDADIWNSNILFQLFNAPEFNASGTKSIVDNKRALEALRWNRWAYEQLGGWNKVHRFLATYQDGLSGQKRVLGPLESGALAFQINGDYNTDKIQAVDPHLSYGVMMIPHPVGIPNTTGTSVLGGNPMVISKDAKDPSAAFTFVAWMATRGEVYAAKHDLMQGNWAATPTYIPLLKDTRLQPNYWFKWFWHELLTNPNARPAISVANEAQWWGLRSTAQQDVLQGTESAREALQSLETTENQDLSLLLSEHPTSK
jgi:multiple sugar transport system substrate-binding protein